MSKIRLTANFSPVLVVIVALLVLSWIAAQGEAETGAQEVFELRRYLAVEDPVQAAQDLRRDAAAWGLDVHKHPEQQLRRLGEVASDSLSIRHADRWTTVCVSDKSFQVGLASAVAAAHEDSMVAVLVYSKAGFSLDDIASIMDSGVRVLDTRGGYLIIVAGNVKRLTALAQEDVCDWMGEFSPAMKTARGFSEVPGGQYTLTSFSQSANHSKAIFID